jgi:hypothetical protein
MWTLLCGELRKEGFLVRDEDVARLAPTIHRYINMMGALFVRDPRILAKGELRPLHDPSEGDA